MQTRFMKRAALGAVGVAAVLAAGAAQAALQDRDLNGDTVTDAFYDTDLNITWLRDANVNGKMTWDTAVSWAANLSFGGYSDWRLPKADTCGEFCGNEMGYLWSSELGNSAGGPMTNTGGFQNLQSDFYCYGTESGLDPALARRFYAPMGGENANLKSHTFFAMAVRPGDVAAVPEPQAAALMLFGLSTLAVAWRRQRPR